MTDGVKTVTCLLRAVLRSDGFIWGLATAALQLYLCKGSKAAETQMLVRGRSIFVLIDLNEAAFADVLLR